MTTLSEQLANHEDDFDDVFRVEGTIIEVEQLSLLGADENQWFGCNLHLLLFLVPDG